MNSKWFGFTQEKPMIMCCIIKWSCTLQVIYFLKGLSTLQVIVENAVTTKKICTYIILDNQLIDI